MEDSYTVHRRRKAAAKRREKTPEPSSRNQLVESSEDEEDARRARMEKMADDAEQQDTENRTKREEQVRDVEVAKVLEETPRIKKREETLEDAVKKPVRDEVVTSNSRARDGDAEEESAAMRAIRKEVESKATEGSVGKDVSKAEVAVKEKSREREAVKGTEAKRAEKRMKKRSKERLERHSRSMDSSDMDEKRDARRTKSPEGVRLRTKKSSAKKSSGESDVPRKDAGEKPPREKRHSKRKSEDETESPPVQKTETGHTGRHSQTEETDDDPKMKRSETFPRQSADEQPIMKRSLTDVKKQIIPLSNESLIQDFAKAQREYLKRERSILEPDTRDVFEDAQQESVLRRRNFSLNLTASEQEEIARSVEESKREPEVKKKGSWFSWLPFFRGKKEEREPAEEKVQARPETPKREIRKTEESKQELPEKVTLLDFFRALKDVVAELKAFVAQNPRETMIMRRLRNRCVAELILVIIYCGLGAFVFRFTEGAFETFYKCGVKRVKRDFLDSLWNYSHNLREDDWKSMARRKLMEFEEQLHTAHEAGVHSYSGQRSWTFLNAVVYCITVITTIGYGHISPSTTTGRAITIVYAIFGIPMFLIILADFGKLFTRGIKFLWAFVRRLYYTGSCRKVRRTGPVQEVMKGVQLVYDFATFRRPSQINPEDIEEMQRQAQQSQAVLNLDGNVPDTPGTPAISAFAIDDEFNLPISVAIFILLVYIFVGATLYYLWEDWGFFESFYFVFISMSTIGFGDYVPQHPIYMMCSIIYLVFGLALTSMCINVVQVMLSDSFKQASQKIGATIGFEVAEEDGSVNPAVPPMVEVADVHLTMKESKSMEKVAPKAKQEDIDL